MPISRRWRAFALVAAVTAAPPGCGPAGDAAPASPAVSADSEAGLKALAEDEALRKERQAQEAKARKRVKGLPEEG